MEPEFRYRLAGVLTLAAILAAGSLFLHAAKRYGELYVRWDDLPVEVRRGACGDRAGAGDRPDGEGSADRQEDVPGHPRTP